MTKASPMKSQPLDDTLMLLRAVDEGDAEQVKSLLAAGADANAISESNETALMRAVSKGHLEVVQVLLDAGGDVHARSENGFTPLFMAVFFGYADIARALLARGSDPAAPTARRLCWCGSARRGRSLARARRVRCRRNRKRRP